MTTTPNVQGFYHDDTNSIAYVVADPTTRQAAIIDAVLDFDAHAASLSTAFADRLLDYIKDQQLSLQWILDTHPHADHLMAAAYLKEQTGAPTAIGERVTEVQKLWRDIYGYDDFPADGRQWDRLFADGETFHIGELPVRVMHSPGHTLASITYVAGDAAFVHDTLLMPDFGTARADFPGGSAALLYDSIIAILELPDSTRIFVGHDYQPGDRETPVWESTVVEQRRANKHLQQATDKGAYIALREGRDRSLPLPALMLHALQFNIRGGRLPEAEANGRHYLKIPVGYFDA